MKSGAARGRLVIFDSVDGAGKGTILSACPHIPGYGVDRVLYSSWDAAPFARASREVLLSPPDKVWDCLQRAASSETDHADLYSELIAEVKELDLVEASPDQLRHHVSSRLFPLAIAATYAQVWEPALASGRDVFSDRGIPGYYAYQVFAGGLSIEDAQQNIYSAFDRFGIPRSRAFDFYIFYVYIEQKVASEAIRQRAATSGQLDYNDSDLSLQQRLPQAYRDTIDYLASAHGVKSRSFDNTRRYSMTGTKPPRQFLRALKDTLNSMFLRQIDFSFSAPSAPEGGYVPEPSMKKGGI